VRGEGEGPSALLEGRENKTKSGGSTVRVGRGREGKEKRKQWKEAGESNDTIKR
jgi:hypothetical protein